MQRKIYFEWTFLSWLNWRESPNLWETEDLVNSWFQYFQLFGNKYKIKRNTIYTFIVDKKDIQQINPRKQGRENPRKGD